MAFIIIEGDNGTGKDTLANEIAGCGYRVINYLPDVKEQEKRARKAQDKTAAFFEYNEYCGNVVKAHAGSNILLIRSWMSTLAAAYSDYDYPYSRIMQEAERFIKTMPRPDYFVRIWCSFDERVRRIQKRNSLNSQLVDDITPGRAHKYEWITKELLYKSGYKWAEFDNSSHDSTKVISDILRYIGCKP